MQTMLIRSYPCSSFLNTSSHLNIRKYFQTFSLQEGITFSFPQKIYGN